MTTVATQKMDFVAFNDLVNWSVRYLQENRSYYKNTFSLVRIGDFLKRNRNIIEIQDDVLYTRVTIRLYTKGVLKRDEEWGRSIGTKRQFVVSPGQFIMSKIDARNGAFGLVPPELDGAVTTADFLSYNVDTERINPEFLTLVSSTKEFLKICQNSSSGTTGRQRVDETQFLNIKIPLPSPAEQARIVDAYNARIDEAQQLAKQAEELEKGIEDYFVEKLGIEGHDIIQSTGPRFYTISLKSLTRWDVWSGRQLGSSSLYDNLTLLDIIKSKPMYGANVSGIDKISDTRYIRITDIREDGELNDQIVSPAEVDERFLLTEGDFLIARSGNTVGKTYLYKESHGRAIFAGYLVKYIIDKSKALPEYVLYFTKSFIFKSWIDSNQKVSGQPNINGQEFLTAPIILPPIEVQREIVLYMSKIRTRIINIQADFLFHRQQAIEEFESELFAL
ncbi:restriction endonuclease subunit S [Spirosoma fluviale]|uniref:Type I restriction enzyme, S subunit n=1 Tax=Spirosoma fluviale TaxID=1597977 RepID=A0A286G178_9BACT|nr:restriction endonuclease subunit S [Spirosoma fluviale]SOD89275.1 type I restriction enzyme, S subunit [Spirosoma fluviale]